MRMVVTSRRKYQFAIDIALKNGEQIRVILPPEGSVNVPNVDPFEINTDLKFRSEVWNDQDFEVCFFPEPDDLPCLFGLFRPNIFNDGVLVARGPQDINFDAGVTATVIGAGNAVNITADIPDPGLSADAFREFISLSGVQNGTNRVFTIPDKAIHNPPGLHLKVYRNGVMQVPGSSDDYTVSESGGAGTGYDTITFAAGCAPKTRDRLWAAYVLQT